MPEKRSGKVLVVDDEKGVRDTVRRILSYEGYTVAEAADGNATLDAVNEGRFDVVLLDIKMPGMDGIEVLKRIRQMDPDLPVLMFSGHGSIATAVETTRIGAFDFMEKPPDRDRLLIGVRNAIAGRRLAHEKASLELALTKGMKLVGKSAAMRRLIAEIARIGPTEAKVLITGENGVGKGVVARAIHRLSRREAGRFVEVSCAAIPDDLIESELFGYEKGAFTGALRRKAGRFEQAEEGTVFLDEVGDAPPSVQVRLLRALQEREIARVGGVEAVKVNVRVAAATNRDLEQMVESGAFRRDLYYRLNVFPIHLPPLREHREDIRPLGIHFLARLSARMHRKPPAVSEAVWRRLEAHDWPGNIRELENFLERALILSPGEELVMPVLGGAETAALPSASAAASGPPVPSFDEATRELLRRALEEAGGRIYGPGGAADRLRLKPTTLQGKLRRYGLTARGGSGT